MLASKYGYFEIIKKESIFNLNRKKERSQTKMQDIYEDTEWNDQLRKRGIIPQREAEITEEDIIDIVEQTVQAKQNRELVLETKTLDELDELEDEEEERILNMMRNKRLAEIQAAKGKARFGSVLEISACDYVKEINQASKDAFVVLHLYKQGYLFLE
jgi:hypothetical protein